MWETWNGVVEPDEGEQGWNARGSSKWEVREPPGHRGCPYDGTLQGVRTGVRRADVCRSNIKVS